MVLQYTLIERRRNLIILFCAHLITLLFLQVTGYPLLVTVISAGLVIKLFFAAGSFRLLSLKTADM